MEDSSAARSRSSRGQGRVSAAGSPGSWHGRGPVSRSSRSTATPVSRPRGSSPNPGRMTYSVPKAAVIMMTKVAAGEWAPNGVRVNAIAPGVLRTPMWDNDVARGAIDEQHYLDVVPMHRLGTPAEVGKLAV